MAQFDDESGLGSLQSLFKSAKPVPLKRSPHLAPENSPFWPAGRRNESLRAHGGRKPCGRGGVRSSIARPSLAARRNGESGMHTLLRPGVGAVDRGGKGRRAFGLS
jgi:hypothetical protein